MTARAWVLLGHRGGDNAQVLALAEALGLPFETFTLVDDRGMNPLMHAARSLSRAMIMPPDLTRPGLIW